MATVVMKVEIEYDPDEIDTVRWYVDECLGRDAYDTPGVESFYVHDVMYLPGEDG